MEIYNLVFMEYDLRPGNKLEPLPAQNVDMIIISDRHQPEHPAARGLLQGPHLCIF